MLLSLIIFYYLLSLFVSFPGSCRRYLFPAVAVPEVSALAPSAPIPQPSAPAQVSSVPVCTGGSGKIDRIRVKSGISVRVIISRGITFIYRISYRTCTALYVRYPVLGQIPQEKVSGHVLFLR